MAEKPYLFEGGSYDTINTKVVTSAGVYKGYVKDKVGNISDACIAVVSFDNEGPTIDILKNGGVGTATINATISDISNVAGYTITSNTSTPTSWTSVNNLASTSASFTKTSAGLYYVHAIDSLGNTSYKEVSLSLSSNSSCSCSRGKHCCWGVVTHHINITTGESYETHDTECDYNEKNVVVEHTHHVGYLKVRRYFLTFLYFVLFLFFNCYVII